MRTRIGGRVVTRTFNRRKDADAFAATVEADKLRGVVIDPRRAQVTVGDFGKHWLAQRPDLAERTADLYEWLFDSYIVPRFGTTNPRRPLSIGCTHVVREDRQGSSNDGSKGIPAAVLDDADSRHRRSHRPESLSGEGSRRREGPERPVATVAEIGALAVAMPRRLMLLVLLACWCQLRRGELLGLRRRDIDLMHLTVNVVQTRTFLMGGAVITKAPKTDAGKRTLSIPPNVTDALKVHLDTFVAPEPDALVFVGEKGGPITTAVLDKAWKHARLAVGRPDLRLHDLRHTGLTLAGAAGATPAELMHRAGHKSTRQHFDTNTPPPTVTEFLPMRSLLWQLRRPCRRFVQRDGRAMDESDVDDSGIQNDA